MKPETYKKWEDALASLSNAEELMKDGKFEEAAKDADLAVWLACASMMTLSDELKMPYLSKTADRYITRWSKRMSGKEHYAPKETVEQAHTTLQRLSDELPADTFRPLR